MNKSLPIPEDIGDYLYVDNKGNLRWVVGRRGVSKDALAGTKKLDGVVVSVNRQDFKAHRIVWFLTYGEQPPTLIDHVNGDPHDNRPDNLRPATKQQNAWNSKVRADSTTGIKGVTYIKKSNQWKAQVTQNGKCINLGHYNSRQQAAMVAADARKQLHGIYYKEI